MDVWITVKVRVLEVVKGHVIKYARIRVLYNVRLLVSICAEILVAAVVHI